MVMPSDSKELLPIVLEDSVNVADRCVLLPGVTVKPCAVLGSGTVTKKGRCLH